MKNCLAWFGLIFSVGTILMFVLLLFGMSLAFSFYAYLITSGILWIVMTEFIFFDWATYHLGDFDFRSNTNYMDNHYERAFWELWNARRYDK